MAEERSSNIPEPIRSHLDRANGLIECVDKNLTYRTERALHCGNDALRELGVACLIHRGIDPIDDLQSQFIKQLDGEVLTSYEIVKAGLLDFGVNPPLHPRKCSREELHQQIERHNRLGRGLRRLLSWVEREMEVYLPCKPGDVILTGLGMGRVRSVEGCTVHTFVPERWGSDPYISISAVYGRVDPKLKPDAMAIAVPSYYFLRDGWRWLNSALGQLDIESRDGKAFVDQARTAVMYASLAWISEREMWMEAYEYPRPEQVVEALVNLQAKVEIVSAVQRAFDELSEFESHLSADSLGMPPSTPALSACSDVLNDIGEECCGLIAIIAGDWVSWGNEAHSAQVLSRNGAGLEVLEEDGSTIGLGIYFSAVRPVNAPVE